jgi:hypothetical protein
LGSLASESSQDDLHALEQKLVLLEDRLTRIENLLQQVLAGQQAPPAMGEVDIDTVETEDLTVPK